jgi:hypothetical protein
MLKSFASQHRLVMGKQGEVEQILDEMCYMETAVLICET